MPAKKKNGNGTNGRKVPAYQRKRKAINTDQLKVIKPLTPNQEKVFGSFGEGKNLILHGLSLIHI